MTETLTVNLLRSGLCGHEPLLFPVRFEIKFEIFESNSCCRCLKPAAGQTTTGAAIAA